MIQNLPNYIIYFFALTTLLTLVLFAYAISQSSIATARKNTFLFLVIAVCWLTLQSILTMQGVYNTNTASFPPKLLLMGILPPMVGIVLSMSTKGGIYIIDRLPLRSITWINIVRIPVEIVLYWLFLNKAVPKLMTFEGRNFDILSGITTPFIVLVAFRKGKINSTLLLIWNIACLLLLINIVANALLSAPLRFQRFAFDQPNIAIINFPFSWLPTFIVPIILFGHLVSIRQLIYKKIILQ